MKTLIDLVKMAKVSKPVIYKRIERIDKNKPEDFIFSFIKVDGKLKRCWTDEEADEIINAALPSGRQKKVKNE